MSEPRTFAVAALALTALVVGIAWAVAHEVDQEIREFAELGEALGVPSDEVTAIFRDQPDTSPVNS